MAIKELGFTGTQSKPSHKQLDILYGVFLGFKDRGWTILHSGDCLGADNAAHFLWKIVGGISHGHPPIISAKRAFCDFDLTDEPLAYLKRNKVIVDRSSVLIAVPKENEPQLRSGTWSTVRYAFKKNKQVHIIQPDGKIRTTYEPLENSLDFA